MGLGEYRLYETTFSVTERDLLAEEIKEIPALYDNWRATSFIAGH